MDLKPGINLLIGDNGIGKMSVLEGMAIAHSGLFVNVAGVSTKNIVNEDVRMIIDLLGNAPTSVTYCEPISAGCSLRISAENNLLNREEREEYVGVKLCYFEKKYDALV